MTENLKPKGQHGGKRANAGRKPNRLKAELPALMEESVPREDRRLILAKMAEGAKAGSVPHATFIFNYLYGKPTERVEHGGDEENPIRILLKLTNATGNNEAD